MIPSEVDGLFLSGMRRPYGLAGPSCNTTFSHWRGHCGGHANAEREAGDGFHAHESEQQNPPSDASIGQDCGRHGTAVGGGTHEVLAAEGSPRACGPSEIPFNQDELYCAKHCQYKVLLTHLVNVSWRMVYICKKIHELGAEQSMHFSRELSELAGAYTATIAILAHRRLACNWPHRHKILSSTPTTQETWRRLFLSVWSRSTNSLQ